MIQVIIPMIVLISVILIKKIPVIGGKVDIALLLAGGLTLLLAGKFNPADWSLALIDGLDRLAWIICLSLFGSIFAEISSELGAIDTIMGAFKAKFGKHPRALMCCILISLTLAGSLLGDAIAAATVIGMLTVGILVSMNIAYEKICAIIIMGACIGSIMPPMTQALAMASSLVGADTAQTDTIMALGYPTVGFVLAVVLIYSCLFLVSSDNLPGTNKEIEIKFDDLTAGEIIRKNWKSLIPMMSLILVVLLRTVKIPYISVDLGPAILKQFTFMKLADGTAVSLFDWLSNLSIIKGVTNGVVLSIVVATCVAFFFPKIRNNGSTILATGVRKVSNTVKLQACCAFMLGAFYTAGSIDMVAEYCQHLDSNMLKIGGVVAMLVIGMLTGSQTTAQNVVFSFFGPALVAGGLSVTSAAMVGAHMANAGQAIPGANLTGFVVVGIVSSQVGKKVNAMKAMAYCLPMVLAFFSVGMFFLFVIQ